MKDCNFIKYLAVFQDPFFSFFWGDEVMVEREIVKYEV